MLKIREEELSVVNGAKEAGGQVGGAKFKMGERVMSKSEPDLGIGTVLDSEYNRGWFYTVAMDNGILYTSESDLEYPILF